MPSLCSLYSTNTCRRTRRPLFIILIRVASIAGSRLLLRTNFVKTKYLEGTLPFKGEKRLKGINCYWRKTFFSNKNILIEVLLNFFTFKRYREKWFSLFVIIAGNR